MTSTRPLLIPIIATGALLGLAHLLLYFFLPQGQLQVIPWFIPAISSILALSAFCVAYLAVGRYQVLHYPAPYWVGVGFIFAGTLALVHVFTFPSLPGGRSVISTVPSMTAWLGNVRVVLLAACYFAAVYATWPGTSASPRRFSLVTTAVCIAGSLLITWLSIRYQHLLPVLVIRGEFTSAGNDFYLLGAAALLGNTLLITRRYLEKGDALFGYAAISQLAFASTLTMRVLGSGWYDLWFYLGRGIHVLGSLVMMFGLFGDYLQLFRRERERTEELQRSEARFWATFENAAVGMAHAGLDGRWLRVNQRMAAFLGYSPEELSSMSFQDVTHPEDLTKDVSAYEQLKRGEINSYTIEKRYIRKDKETIWCRLTVSLLRSPDGTPLHAISLVEDITDRKQAEEALREAKEEAERRAAVLDQVLEVLPVGLILADNSGRMLKANRAFGEIWGASPLPAGIDEYRKYKGWWPGLGRRLEPHEWPIARSVMERVYSDEEIEIESFDGKRKIIRAIAAPVLDRHGNHFGSVAVTWDITGGKRAVVELQKARDHLELRVKERTAELTQALQDLRTETEERIRAVEELRRGEQLLIQQGRMAAMGEMLRNISHQWRQPLNVLAARVQKLGITYQYGGFSEELLRETITQVMATIKEMSRTIDEFEEFLEPKKEKSFFVVDEVIRRTIGVLGEAFKSQGISIEFQSSDAAAQLYGDANEYGQVLMNLLANAKDALLQRRETERRIWINARIESGRSVVTVTDNAGGIEEGISDKIFDAYFTTKQLGEGTGVGLFLSKMIIEKNMGGRLSFRNVEGGAEFEIRV